MASSLEVHWIPKRKILLRFICLAIIVGFFDPVSFLNVPWTRQLSECNTDLVNIPTFFENGCWHNLKNEVIFLHLGKGGGGTVEHDLHSNKIKTHAQHPTPVKMNKIKQSTVIVNIRDPVDRFVSAFRWRVAVLCGPHDRRRKSAVAHKYPLDWCKNGKVGEEKMLREAYKSDANVMAEALCEDSPLHEQAVADFSKIMHSAPLSKWLNYLIEPNSIKEVPEHIQELIVVPMEKQGINGTSLFQHHIEQMSLHLMQNRYDESTAKSLIFEAKKAKKAMNGKSGSEAHLHSSVRFNAKMKESSNKATKKATPSELSPLGECCLARHLQKDYRVIQTMLGNEMPIGTIQPLKNVHPLIHEVCSWGDDVEQELCRSDLRSMLLRRAQYLDSSLGSCSQVVPNN